MIGLLGDMRSYNYVIIPTHDFDQVVYRIRAIDFDQQCYEGNLKIYLPQYFKENIKMVELVQEKLKPNSIEQYKRSTFCYCQTCKHRQQIRTSDCYYEKRYHF
jgi:hypothetical protein